MAEVEKARYALKTVPSTRQTCSIPPFMNTEELDGEIERSKAQILALAEFAMNIGHEKDALRLYRAYRFLNKDPDVTDSEMKAHWSPQVRHFRK